VIYHKVAQGTEEWHRLRLGIPTASNFDRIMMPSKMQLSKSADKYIARLISERMSPYLPERAESYTSRSMAWGQQTEEEARRYYALHKGVALSPGGFCTTDDGRLGCSPDALIGDDGGLELKCPEPETHIRYLLKGELPDEYKPQVHGCLIVTGRKWWDFMSYAILEPFREPLVVRVTPNLYTERLRRVIYDEFLPRYEAIFSTMKGD
jgi:hypothetical protein